MGGMDSNHLWSFGSRYSPQRLSECWVGDFPLIVVDVAKASQLRAFGYHQS